MSQNFKQPSSPPVATNIPFRVGSTKKDAAVTDASCSKEATYKMYTKKRRRSNVVEKFREVSDSVWVSFEAVITENTLKEECTGKNDINDNYNYYGEG